MLKISNKTIKPVTFLWEDNGKKPVELQITQMTIADRLKLNDLYNTIFEDKKIKGDVESDLLNVAKISCCIKDMKGNYFFTKNPEQTHKLLNGEALFTLVVEVSKINPNVTQSLDEAKK